MDKRTLKRYIFKCIFLTSLIVLVLGIIVISIAAYSNYTNALETTGEEILLAGEGKLTVELVEAYEQSAGTALNVVIHVGYIGDDDGVLIKDELEAAAIKALGLTADAFWALVAGPDGSEWMDRLIAEKNRIVYNEDYQENVAESYLLEGELVDIVYHAWEIRAVMTYERAMEISKHKEIGYIDLKEK